MSFLKPGTLVRLNPAVVPRAIYPSIYKALRDMPCDKWEQAGERQKWVGPNEAMMVVAVMTFKTNNAHYQPQMYYRYFCLHGDDIVLLSQHWIQEFPPPPDDHDDTDNRE